MGVSQVVCVTLSTGAMEVLETRPVLLTSVLVAERSGSAAAKVLVVSSEGDVTHMQFGVPAGQSFAWADRVALGSGLAVMSLAGSVAVTLAYE